MKGMLKLMVDINILDTLKGGGEVVIMFFIIHEWGCEFIAQGQIATSVTFPLWTAHKTSLVGTEDFKGVAYSVQN